MLKVLRNPPNVMGEHMPLHVCACLDHACQVHQFEVLTYLPWCLPPPHRQFHSALPVYRERYCGNPHKGMLVARQGGSESGFGALSICPLPSDGINGVGPYTPSQSALALYSTCTDLTISKRLGP